MPQQEITNERVGEIMRAAREKKGLSQRQLADMVGVSEQSLAHYERGRSGLSVTRLGEIAKALGISAKSLLP
jgi:transcriptional regulator with XRE-family HTH domain